MQNENRAMSLDSHGFVRSDEIDRSENIALDSSHFELNRELASGSISFGK